MLISHLIPNCNASNFPQGQTRKYYSFFTIFLNETNESFFIYLIIIKGKIITFNHKWLQQIVALEQRDIKFITRKNDLKIFKLLEVKWLHTTSYHLFCNLRSLFIIRKIWIMYLYVWYICIMLLFMRVYLVL